MSRIIGAGMSGLAAGIRLAYYDKSVCILERHTTIGGLNSFYRLRGRNYDVGLHACTNYSPPGAKDGTARQSRCGNFACDGTISIFRRSGSPTVVFPDCTLRFTNDIAELTQQIAERFPREVDGFRRLIARITQCEITGLSLSGLSARSVVAEYLRDPFLDGNVDLPAPLLRQRIGPRHGFQPVRDHVPQHLPRGD